MWYRGSGPEAALGRERDVGLLQLLDVDVLERHHADVLDEPRRPVHVPHPGVVHLDLEVDLAVDVADVQVDLVGQIEPALRLHHVRELTHDVAVLAIELELHLGLVLLEILGAHRVPPSLSLCWTAPTGPPGLANPATL